MNNTIGILRKVFVLLLTCVLLQSCSTTPATSPSGGATTGGNNNPAPNASGSPSANATPNAPASTDIPTPVPGPLDWLLALRSVKIDESATFPDGSTYSYAIEIDSSGNMRVTEDKPVMMYTRDLPDPTAVDTKKLSGAETVYIVDGKAYEPDSSDPGWNTTPVDDDYVQTLSDLLNGPDGPGLWLDILTDDAFASAGNENTGGFDADKYNVNGQFNGQTISGTVWFDSKTDALIKADLTVPAVLMDPSDQTGMYKITLDTQQATIEPVTLPDISTPTEQTTPAPTTVSSSLSQPEVIAHYCLLSDCSDYQYPGDMLSGNMGGIDGVMLVLPDQIWTAAYPQGIQEWDLHDGHLLSTISADYEVGNFMDIEYDGKQIWAAQYVPTSSSDIYRVFYVVDPQQGSLVKKISLKYSESDYHSFLFGVSPGKVWLEQQWIDTNTLQINDAQHYIACPDQHFAYDGQGSLWVTGDVIPDLDCDRYLYVWNASDPTGQPLPSDTQDAFDDSPLVLANGKMWMMAHKEVQTKSGWEKHWILTAFDLKDATKPVIQVDISSYMPELNGDLIMAADNKAIWIVPDDIKGDVEYFDQSDGHYMGSLHVGQLIEGMGFDGSSLWVMDNEHGLEQIALPWAP